MMQIMISLRLVPPVVQTLGMTLKRIVPVARMLSQGCVAPAREVGIVIGVMLGVFLLKEPFGLGRLLGSGFVVAGLALIALSP